jgi:lycopene cyclase domain-containing protein
MQLCFLYAAIRLKCESMGLTAGRFWHWFSRQQQDNRIPANAVLHRYGLIILGIISLVIGVGIIRRLRGGDSVGTKEEYRDTRGLPVYKEGKWYPGWLIAIVPFVVIGIAWMRSTIRLINMPALLISVSLNVSLYLLFEYNAIMRGHWVYNEQRLIGWRLAGTIPLEQLLLYFVSFLFLVPFFECVRHFLITTFGNAQQKQTHAESLGLDRLIRLDDCRVKL